MASERVTVKASLCHVLSQASKFGAAESAVVSRQISAEATLYLARLEGKGSSGTSSKSLLPGQGGLSWLLSRKPHSFRPERQCTDRVGNTTFENGDSSIVKAAYTQTDGHFQSLSLPMPTRVLIVGAGAVGAFYGSRLSLTPSCLVSALCRSNYTAVKANGFYVTSPQYDSFTFKPAQTFANADEVRESNIQWDYLLVSTKALPDVSDDSNLLEGLVGPTTAIVLVQNGLGVEEPYAKRFPHATLLSAVTIASVAQPSAGQIKHNRWTRISIGPYFANPDKSNARATDQNTEFVQMLQTSGIKDAEAYDHAGLQFVRWHKIAINAAMNPTAVLSGGTPNATMANDPELAAFLLGMMNEVLETAPKVLGRPLPKKLASAEQILKSTKRNDSGSKPSMLLDWEQGKRMELEVILGNPIRIAREKGLEMPRLQALYALLRKAQENRENGEGWVTRESKL